MTVRQFHIACPLALMLFAAACVPRAPEVPESTPTPTPAPVSQPQPAAAPPSVVTPTFDNWMDAPQTPGDWSYRQAAGWTEALFGDGNGEPLLVFRCTRQSRTVQLIRRGSATASVPMLIRSEGQDRTLTALPAPGPTPGVVATIPANDSLLDAIAFSKGRFAVAVEGLPTLYPPSWPEITRVIEDCR
ncbi:hypothetical protein [Altericroceibacterium xinjiangense]|uniref:hypothetical protein n=1 Tax=Altericroceibacterium xinjiangense TaxID=762261 RepID=UPI000F7D8B86|nr:hypothetical protein [Altericroceibacterium xinjiangense]